MADELFEQKKLDPFLQFASQEEAAEYRKREAEREAYIRAELAKGTPQGALNASNATLAQLDDARDHGAEQSPDFDRLYQTTIGARDAQRAAIGKESAQTIAPAAAAQDAANTLKVEEPKSDVDEIAAALRMAGVVVPDFTPSNSHGLNSLVNAESEHRGRSG